MIIKKSLMVLLHMQSLIYSLIDKESGKNRERMVKKKSRFLIIGMG
jgi:hypothetical protein